LEIPVLLLHFLKSGEINLLTKGIKRLKLKAKNKNIDINLLDSEILKDLIKFGSRKISLGKLRSLRHIADNLKKEGVTVAIYYESSIILRLGSEANPSFLGDAIEIRNLSKLLRLFLM